jgi:undecaprenyl-diphosphatase
MEPTFLQILLLGLIQGAAELLPVSSSAHVIVAEKLMGFDPSSPSMTFLLVMLHTGTMIAVITYFWKAWSRTFFSSTASLRSTIVNVGAATAATGVIGLGLKALIEKLLLQGSHQATEVEHLFGNLHLIATALLVAGILILVAGSIGNRGTLPSIGLPSAIWMGISQGFCMPFRGLSRSGATISVGMLLGITRLRVEEFSFALAVVITPGVVALELKRLLKSHEASAFPHQLLHQVGPGLIGMVAAFFAGLLALRLLSSWLEKGHWAWFGYYCLAFSGVVFFLASLGL